MSIITPYNTDYAHINDSRDPFHKRFYDNRKTYLEIVLQHSDDEFTKHDNLKTKPYHL